MLVKESNKKLELKLLNAKVFQIASKDSLLPSNVSEISLNKRPFEFYRSCYLNNFREM